MKKGGGLVNGQKNKLTMGFPSLFPIPAGGAKINATSAGKLGGTGKGKDTAFTVIQKSGAGEVNRQIF